MAIIDLITDLEQNTYPGRGIIIGKNADNTHAMLTYFIMGRSENSLNRVFEEDLNDGIRTRAFDESKMADPTLVIYTPVRIIGDFTVVTNGDQTDTICDFIDESSSFEAALRTRTFEPDPPIFTPRISGIADFSEGGFRYKLSILKSADGNGDSVRRFFYEYPTPIHGEGHFIHTYQMNGNPPPSFFGEPKTVNQSGTIDTYTDQVWNALNADHKISLFIRYINIATGEFETRIRNRFQ